MKNFVKHCALRITHYALLFASVLILLTGTAKASDAEYLLNNAELNPTTTGADYCDEIVWQTLNQITSDNMSTYDKVRACYDYLVRTCSYGDNVLRLDFPEDNGTARAYGMLVGHVGACDDYSCAFAALTAATRGISGASLRLTASNTFSTRKSTTTLARMFTIAFA